MAKVTGSVLIPKIIEALKIAQQSALEQVGENSTDILKAKLYDNDSVVTERLLDSTTWATKKTPASPGPNAFVGEEVDQPSSPDAVVFGTQAPYASSVNYGTINNFQYGVNGAPANVTELYKAILLWLKDKVANGSFTLLSAPGYAENIEQVARNITLKIEERGTDAHPFWEPSLVEIKEYARKAVIETFNERLAMIPDATQLISSKGVTIK